MTRRALGGLGAAVAVALLFIGVAPLPARAVAPVINWSSPSPDQSFGGPAAIAGNATIPSNQSGNVSKVTLLLSNSQDPPRPIPDVSETFTVEDPVRSLPFSWNPALPSNGIYTVRADVEGCDGLFCNDATSSSDSRTFRVEAPPAPAANLKVINVDQAKRTVTLSWTKSTEPDLIGYGIYLRGSTTALGIVQANQPQTFTHQLGNLPAGTYTYDVIAARPNAASDGVVISPTRSVSGKVSSAPPSPSTTSTAPRAGSGGSTATTATTAKGGPTVATRGRNDLSGFAALLPNGGAKLPSVPRSSAQELDSGFQQDLPFQRPDALEGDGSGDDDAVALGGRELATSEGDERPTSLLFMAGGLLVTVVLMHLLWLRDEVNKELPAVEPGEPL